MSGLALFLIMSGSMFLGFGLGVALGRARQAADERSVAGLHEALVRTQEALGNANALTAEAVAAQEAAERMLKEQFARRSDGSKRAWVTRKSNAEVSRAS